MQTFNFHEQNPAFLSISSLSNFPALAGAEGLLYLYFNSSVCKAEHAGEVPGSYC